MLFNYRPSGFRDFKLAEPFIDNYRDKQPNWGFGALSYVTYKRCVDINTPVLCDDLIWRPAGALEAGQGIIGFDAHSKLVYRTHKRYLRHGHVTYNKIEKAHTMGIELENGSILYATPDHSWLVKFDGNNAVHWRETKDLASTCKNNPVYLQQTFGPVWAKDKSYEAGFLSAAYDGEGNLDRLTGIQFCQANNSMLQQVENYLQNKEISFKKRLKSNKTSYKYKNKRQDCYTLRTHGVKRIFRLLGILRPPRLLDRFKYFLTTITTQERGQELRCKPEDYIKVIRVFDAGIRDVAVLSTSIGTHFTGGFASHNTYSQILSDQVSEEFWQTIRRVVEGCYTIQKLHCTFYGLPWSNRKAQRSAQIMYDLMWNFKFLPPGRGLRHMGMPYIFSRGAAYLLSCAFVSSGDIKTDYSAPFAWAMDMSMLGVGVGFDTLGNGTIKIVEPSIANYTFIVDDSREGWVELYKTILDSYIGKGSYPKNIDYSKIREKGSLLKTIGGVSSGPQPLIDLIISITQLYNSYIDKIADSALIVDTFSLAGKCVVSGGIRRTALAALGDASDQQFIDLKLDKEALASHRWAFNSAIKSHIGMSYDSYSQSTIVRGDLGYLWLDNIRAYGRMADPKNHKDYRVLGCNPCFEQSLESYEMCNLVETFPAHHENEKDYLRTLKYAYLYGKTVTLLPTHDIRSNAIMGRNKRIGLSQSGIMQSFEKHGRRNHLEWCDNGYEYIQKLDKIYSDWLICPRSIKTTSVKPSGTISLLAGATPGIHYSHSEYYIRRVRIADTSPLVDICRKAGYGVEKAINEPNTFVVAFPIHSAYSKRDKTDVTMWEQLENAADMQAYWADNQVSVTVSLKEYELDQLPYALEVFETRLKGVSFLPPSTDHPQMPYETIDKQTYKKLTKDLKPIEDIIASSLGHEADDKFCDGDTCTINIT